MRAMTNSEITEKLGLSANDSKEVALRQEVKVTIHACWNLSYDFTVTHILAEEKEKGMSSVSVKGRDEAGCERTLVWSAFSAKAKKAIQELIF